MTIFLRNALIFLLVLVLMAVAGVVGYSLAFRNLIYPRTTVAGIEVGGMDKESALRLINLYFAKDPNKVVLRGREKEN